MTRKLIVAVVPALVACSAFTMQPPSQPGTLPPADEQRPLVIAHRGASGHRPEHTLPAYALAIAMGADYIELDLVSTRDGVLVARHENEIGATTDVAQKFSQRRNTRVIDGDSVTGWFTEDFTWDELRTLRANERLPSRSHAYDGHFGVPRLEDVLALADSAGRRRGRVVGVYAETKHPSYFRSIGLPLEESLLAALHAHGLDRRDAPVFIQSFESGNLRALRTKTRVRLVQLVYDTTQVTPAALREIATYADAVGPNTRLIVPASIGGRATSVIRDAHAAGLLVHAWTLRPESEFLAARYRGDPLAEVRELAALGVDGMFGDFPDLVLEGLGRGPASGR
ncbi:MAG: glycerophosphodiester phosphodiesterase [Anaerolineae bacterium]|nr:glycerophosphodiester phosphodiesterase [Gemmatimonadaceae bacterium]